MKPNGFKSIFICILSIVIAIIQSQAFAASVTTLTPNPATINDATVSTGFSLTIVYDEAMQNTTAPTISFPVESPGSVLTLNSANSQWTTTTTYYAEYTVTDTNVDIANIDVSISGALAQDDGSIQTAYAATDVFSIALSNATVTTITPTPATITDGNVGGTLTLNIAYSRNMVTGVKPTVDFPVENPLNTITYNDASSSWVGPVDFRAVFSIADANEIVSDIDVHVSGAIDQATGNPQTNYTQTNVFSINTASFTASSVSPSIASITESNVGGTFTLTIAYPNVMNTATAPTITFPVENASTTLTLSATSNWSDTQTYNAIYTVADANVSLPNVDVRVTGAVDTNGITQLQYDAADVFSINTSNASVSSITPSISTITDANVGQLLTIAIVYPIDMNTAIAPTITFPVEDATTTLTLAATSGWSGTLTYNAVYLISDANVSLPNVDVRVAGAVDSIGNTQAQYDAADLFSIQTSNASISAIAPNLATIIDSNAGSNFTLTVTYGSAMNTSIAPTITFPVEDPSSTLTGAGGSWTTSTTYQAVYTISDANASIANIDVQVSGAVDTIGNTQTPITQADVFSIQMSNATVGSVTPNLTTISDVNVGSGTFTITLTFDMDMNQTIKPTISFPVENPSNTITYVDASSLWSDARTFKATYNVADANENVSAIDIQVSGATDLIGNVQSQTDQPDVFSINTTNATVSSLTPSAVLIIDSMVGDNTFNITIVFDRNMNQTIMPTLSYPVEDPTPTITLDSAASSWSSATTYVAVFDVADADQLLADIDVAVSGATDTLGNVQTASTSSDVFSIDTQPGVIYIKSDATGANNGTSWANAFTSIAAGIAAANDEDTVLVYAGLTYNEPALTSWSTRNTVTILSTSPLDPSGTIVQASGTNAFASLVTNITNSRVQGLTFRSFHNTGSGGAFNLDTNNSIVFNYCSFSGNSAANGGAIAIGTGSNITFNNCTFSSNSATSGGAIYNQFGTVNVVNDDFNGNTSSGGNGGGAICNDAGSTSVIQAATFDSNNGTNGGAISNYGIMSIVNGVFIKNGGSTLYNSGGTATATNCTFFANTGAAISGSGVSAPNSIDWKNGGASSASGLFTSDPLFVNESTFDLTLQETSTCIGAASGAPATDRLGINRASFGGTGSDIGAYEYISTGNVRSLVAAKVPEDFEMITLGHDISKESAWSLLSRTLGVYDVYYWRLFRWDPSTLGYIEADSIPGATDTTVSPCRSYWIISAWVRDLTFAPPINHYNSYEIVLKPGYNMVGNPFMVSLTTADIEVRDQNNGTYVSFASQSDTGPIYKWDRTLATPAYVQVTTLEPFGGFFIENQTTSDLYIKFKGPYSP